MKNRIAAVLALAVVAIACRRNKAPKYANDQAEPQPQPQAPPTPVAASSGTCAGACTHYLQCKGNVDPNAQPACMTKCQQMKLTVAQLQQYEATDCATAIWQAESSGGASGSGTAKPKSSECNGCVWDGSSCIWLSSGNWGAGPYSGASSSCAAYCCPGH